MAEEEEVLELEEDDADDGMEAAVMRPILHRPEANRRKQGRAGADPAADRAGPGSVDAASVRFYRASLFARTAALHPPVSNSSLRTRKQHPACPFTLKDSEAASLLVFFFCVFFFLPPTALFNMDNDRFR